MPNTARNGAAAGDEQVHNLRMIRTALEHLDDGFSVYDADLRLVAWNARFFEMLGFPPERFARVGVAFDEFLWFNALRGEYGPGDAAQQVAERVEKARNCEPHFLERTRPDGTMLEIRGNPLPGGGFVTIYKDITERRRAELALKESHDLLERRVQERTAELRRVNERLLGEMAERKKVLEALRESREWIRLFADTVPVAIGYVDSGQRYRFANKAYEQWFGLPPDKIVGRSVREIVSAEMYAGHEPHMRAALDGVTSSREFALSLPDGRVIQTIATFIPHIGEQGTVQGYFVLGQDVSEQRQAEAIMRQAQKMEAIGQLTGGLAHDFNNLLTIMIGNLAGLKEEAEGLPEIASQLDPALDAARRGANLVRRLLSFARRHPLQPRLVDVGELVAGMTELIARTLGTRIAISIAAKATGAVALIDPHQFENALLNLVINARDAMPEGGRLSITVAELSVDARLGGAGEIQPGRHVTVTVQDSGVGMPAAVLERVFEPFFTTKDKGSGSGSGLGLSMVYGFVKQSLGHVEIASRPGEGTTVTMLLPRADGPAEPLVGREAPASSPGGSERVLIVEDDPGVRDFAAGSLRRLGYDVVEAADGREALDLLDAGAPFALLLTDIEMPGGVDGVAVAREALRRTPAIRVLFMSGYTDKVPDLGPGLGQGDILLKPFEKHALAAAVRSRLEAP